MKTYELHVFLPNAGCQITTGPTLLSSHEFWSDLEAITAFSAGIVSYDFRHRGERGVGIRFGVFREDGTLVTML